MTPRFKHITIKSIWIIGLFCCLAAPLRASNDFIDSMEHELANHEQMDTSKVKMLNRLSFAYRSIDPKEMERLGFEALELARDLAYEEGEGNAYQFIAISHRYRGNYEKAHHFLDKSIRVHEEIADQTGLSQNYLNKGNIHHSRGQYKKALDHYFHALKIVQENNNLFIEGQCLNNIGNVYYSQQKLEKASTYYEKSLKKRKEVDDKNGVAKCLNNLGTIYSDQGKFEKARDHLKRSLAIKQELNDKAGIAHTLNNLGTIEKSLNHYEPALNYFERSLSIKKEIGYQAGIVQSLNNIGSIFKELGKLDTAKHFLKKAKTKADRIGTKDLEIESYAYLTSVDSAKGNFEKALAWQQQFNQLKDSISNVEKSKEIAAIEAKYQTAKKEAQLQESRQKVYMLGGGLFLVFLIGTIFILYYRSKQKSARLRAEKNEALALQQQNELEKQKQEQALKSVLEGQEMERKRIGEELHDGLGARLAGLKLNIANNLTNNGAPQQNGKALKNLEKEIDDVCQELRTISHNLMPPALLQNSLSEAIYDFINEANVTQPNFHIECDILSSDQINSLNRELQMSIYRIVQELVNNVIKHADASEAHLQIIPHETYINIILEDDGQGFNPEQKHEGVGLNNVQSRINLLKGELKVDSNPQNGSLFNLNIPISHHAAREDQG